MANRRWFTGWADPAAAAAFGILLAPTLFHACAGDTESGSGGASAVALTTTVDTIDGVVRVANAGTPPRWQLTQVASIGPATLSETGSPDEFGRVYDVPGRWWEYIGLDSRGETGDTLLQLEGPSAATIHCEVGDRTSFFQVPFGPKLVQRPGPGGVMYSATTDAYRIALTDAYDDTVRVIERPLPREPISDTEWAEGNSGYRALRDTFPLMSCDPLRPPRPDAKPFIEQIDIASDGKLWVDVIREAGNRWEVFDAEGRLVASVPVPAERQYLLPPAINADHILTVRRGDLDLEYVDVWRIEKGGR